MRGGEKLLRASCLFLFLSAAVRSSLGFRGENSDEISGEDFPESFVFGAGTSAYQVEGAVAEDGRGPSIWDTFTHQGFVVDKSTADVTADQYHKYKEDVKLMSDMELEAYRFSISWSRLIPNGRGTINPKGLEYYNNLINELVKHGIQPHATLIHLDWPQAIEDEYMSWLSRNFVKDFTAYADVCFRKFGDRVTHWTTFNEPNVMSIASYDNGLFPPRRCSGSDVSIFNCTGGNSSVEPYLVGHVALLAHASAARLYKKKYQAKQKGFIGMNIYSFWFSPYSNSASDVEATQRAIDFYIGWFADPLVFGDYPKIMKKYVGSRLPRFTKQESEFVKGAVDFFGINHYSSVIVEDASNDPPPNMREFNSDIFVKYRFSRDDEPDSQLSPFSLPSVPSGLRGMLNYMNRAYGNLPLYIHENGFGLPFNSAPLNDTPRVQYLKGYINATLGAIRDGSNVKGYIMWSFLDVFEFLSGFSSRYGLYHVDFNDKNLAREPKYSAHWYANFLKGRKKMRMVKEGFKNTTGKAAQ